MEQSSVRKDSLLSIHKKSASLYVILVHLGLVFKTLKREDHSVDQIHVNQILCYKLMEHAFGAHHIKQYCQILMEKDALSLNH